MSLHSFANRTKKLSPLRVGIGRQVGSCKTTLLEMLCKAIRDKYDLVAITNDIDTKEDQRLLMVSGALSDLTIYVIDVAAAGKKFRARVARASPKATWLPTWALVWI